MARKTTSRSKSTRKQRSEDSGLPGGGKGRRDETGITNVYPASGPVEPPSGNATLQPMGTWGQADRGPEGYYDSGDSELFTMPAEQPARRARATRRSSTTAKKSAGTKKNKPRR
jgi:hypothetical protein